MRHDRIGKLKIPADDPHDAFVKHALALEYCKLGEDAAARRFGRKCWNGTRLMWDRIINWGNCWNVRAKKRCHPLYRQG